jgi:arylsulfatase A-like enzyme
MMTKKILKGAILLFFLMFSLYQCHTGSKKTNVILIVVDTLRADHLSCYGYYRNTTPHIDDFSRESLLFKNAISAAPWTSPSVASLFTSFYPIVLDYEANIRHLDDSFLTMAEIFKENDYDTKGIIAHYLIASKLKFGQGFDSYDQDNLGGPDNVSSHSITEKASVYLEDHKDSNFFLFLHYFDPHENYMLHEDYDYYPDYDGPLYSGQPIYEGVRDIASSLTPEDIEYLKALYDSEISYVDEYLGKLFDKLKELDLYDNTLIIITSDHGEEFCERGNSWIGHTRTVYQELIHVPLIIKVPHKNDHKVVEEYVGLIDILPTLVKQLGLKTSEKMDMEGAIINLNNGKRSQNSEIVSETRREAFWQSVIKDGWKYMADIKRNDKRLYNLLEDPEEKNNLSKERREITKQYEGLLQTWFNKISGKKSRYKVGQGDHEFTPEELKKLQSLGYFK